MVRWWVLVHCVANIACRSTDNHTVRTGRCVKESSDLSTEDCIFVDVNPQPHASISSHAQYVILHSIIAWRNVKTCRIGSGKWFWLNIIAEFAVG